MTDELDSRANIDGAVEATGDPALARIDRTVLATFLKELEERRWCRRLYEYIEDKKWLAEHGDDVSPADW
jgi:hypothetical protein